MSTSNSKSKGTEGGISTDAVRRHVSVGSFPRPGESARKAHSSHAGGRTTPTASAGAGAASKLETARSDRAAPSTGSGTGTGTGTGHVPRLRGGPFLPSAEEAADTKIGANPTSSGGGGSGSGSLGRRALGGGSIRLVPTDVFLPARGHGHYRNHGEPSSDRRMTLTPLFLLAMEGSGWEALMRQAHFVQAVRSMLGVHHMAFVKLGDPVDGDQWLR